MNKIRQLLNVNEFHKKGYLGQGVTIAVLDSGAYMHSDYKDRILDFKDYINNRALPYDDFSHGTHVCGIMCGSGKTNKAYIGMAPLAKIIPIKVLDNTGHGDSENIINATKWIINYKKRYNIRIVNISIGTKAKSCAEENSTLVKSVDSLWDAGLIVVVSAGNNGPNYQSITIPGISRKVITVGSCKWNNDKNNSASDLSGKGPTYCNIEKPDIVVPGDNIISCSLKNGYTKKSGTSMSTPILSGAAALILSYNPTISNNVFKDYIKKSALDLGYDKYTQGSGRLDLDRLFLLANPSIN